MDGVWPVAMTGPSQLQLYSAICMFIYGVLAIPDEGVHEDEASGLGPEGGAFGSSWQDQQESRQSIYISVLEALAASQVICKC